MKFTLSWLKEHLDTDASLETLTDALTDLGLELEGVDDPADRLGAFTICRVLEAKQHPNADKLRLCRVEAWPNGPDAPAEEVQVVCGAPNARTGLVGVFAAPGTFVPGTEVLLKPGVIRGEASNGMLCSERELMISEDHEGIIDLPEDAPLGQRFIDYAGLDDPMIHVSVTPNRPDALGVRGVARDLAARGLGRLKPDVAAPVEGAFPCPVAVTLAPDVRREDEEAAAACPHFVGRVIDGVTNGPSPAWMQQRLRAIGLRPINALVDVTNYLTFDRARPLHVFDADKISGGIKVRLAREGESLKALNGAEYALDPEVTVVCDKGGRRVESLGGVMGGEASGCDETTKRVFIEGAYFDPVRTAETGRRLEILSDARFRFERGVDPLFTESGVELATAMILEICGGSPSALVVAGKPAKHGRNGYDRRVKFDTDRVAGLVGMDVPREEQARILEALGFEVANARQRVFTVRAPSWRPDVRAEADLVEEVARVASLSKLEAAPLPRPSPEVLRPVLTPLQRRSSAVRRALASAGLSECVTYTFIDAPEAEAFGGGDAARTLQNPIASDKAHMRPSVLPGLLAAAQRNADRSGPSAAAAALFEVGPEFFGGEPGEQREVAAGLRTGPGAPRHWAEAQRPVDLYDAKSDALTALEALGAPVEKLMLDREVAPWWHPGRSARLKLGPKVVLAEFGELHPRTLRSLGVTGPAAAFIVYIEAVPGAKAKTKARPPLELMELQPVERDFAFVVDARTEAESLLRAAKAADKKLIAAARVFDVFEGAAAEAQLGAGKKSVALEVILQPREKTLTAEEIDAVAGKVVDAVTAKTGASLRT